MDETVYLQVNAKKKLERLELERKEYSAIEDGGGGGGGGTAIKKGGYGYQKGGYAQRFPIFIYFLIGGSSSDEFYLSSCYSSYPLRGCF